MAAAAVEAAKDAAATADPGSGTVEGARGARSPFSRSPFSLACAADRHRFLSTFVEQPLSKLARCDCDLLEWANPCLACLNLYRLVLIRDSARRGQRKGAAAVALSAAEASGAEASGAEASAAGGRTRDARAEGTSLRALLQALTVAVDTRAQTIDDALRAAESAGSEAAGGRTMLEGARQCLLVVREVLARVRELA
jgi:hypothetical protein